MTIATAKTKGGKMMTNAIDFIQDMIANYVSDESLAQCILAFMADHPDGESLSDFVHWADGWDAEKAARRMTQRGCDAIELIGEFVAECDRKDFCVYAAANFPGIVAATA